MPKSKVSPKVLYLKYRVAPRASLPLNSAVWLTKVTISGDTAVYTAGFPDPGCGFHLVYLPSSRVTRTYTFWIKNLFDGFRKI